MLFEQKVVVTSIVAQFSTFQCQKLLSTYIAQLSSQIIDCLEKKYYHEPPLVCIHLSPPYTKCSLVYDFERFIQTSPCLVILIGHGLVKRQILVIYSCKSRCLLFIIDVLTIIWIWQTSHILRNIISYVGKRIKLLVDVWSIFFKYRPLSSVYNIIRVLYS